MKPAARIVRIRSFKRGRSLFAFEGLKPRPLLRLGSPLGNRGRSLFAFEGLKPNHSRAMVRRKAQRGRSLFAFEVLKRMDGRVGVGIGDAAAAACLPLRD
ncbi:protein of unknown function [Candidatus Promineifilum breve]|uniref:Uncharacterized protein n=1 Tax=Candidatus Promineifilum breve TaxID=1806508 RepID=A0A160T849_9CHLR|nr:protein of unknown function [Candidatus Promineifilum breve]